MQVGTYGSCESTPCHIDMDNKNEETVVDRVDTLTKCYLITERDYNHRNCMSKLYCTTGGLVTAVAFGSIGYLFYSVIVLNKTPENGLFNSVLLMLAIGMMNFGQGLGMGTTLSETRVKHIPKQYLT